MRKLLSTVAAVAVAGGLAYTIAYSSNIPLLTGPSCAEAGAQLQCLNQLIQSVNSGVTGNYAFVPGPVGNSGGGTTTANFTFASAVIPTGALVAAGQGYRARCAGVSGVTTTAKYGIAIGRSMAVSLENWPTGGAINNPEWDLDIEFRAATTPVTANVVWMARAFAGIASGTTSGAALSINSGNDTTVTDNNANLALPITCVAYGGIATGFATMMNFSVEQLR